MLLVLKAALYEPMVIGNKLTETMPLHRHSEEIKNGTKQP